MLTSICTDLWNERQDDVERPRGILKVIRTTESVEESSFDVIFKDIDHKPKASPLFFEFNVLLNLFCSTLVTDQSFRLPPISPTSGFGGYLESSPSPPRLRRHESLLLSCRETRVESHVVEGDDVLMKTGC